MNDNPENEYSDEKRLNPQIAEADVGTRNLRTIKIYPLSMSHQKKLTEKIATVLAAFADLKEGTEGTIALISYLLTFVTENLEEILGMATDEDASKLMDELTVDQADEIGTIIYEQNYEGLLKKVQNLFKGKLASLTKRLSQPLSNDTDNTGLNIFTPLASEKEE